MATRCRRLSAYGLVPPHPSGKRKGRLPGLSRGGGKVADQLGREYNVTNVILNLFQDPLVFAIDAMLSHGSGVQESGAID
jgi:hypothetical protein